MSASPSPGMGQAFSKQRKGIYSPESDATTDEDDKVQVQTPPDEDPCAAPDVPYDTLVHALQEISSRFASKCCQADCGRQALFEPHWPLTAWKTGAQTIPPTTQLSTVYCDQRHATCAGCGLSPTMNSQSLFTPIGVINHCCDAGRIVAIWIMLSIVDEAHNTARAIKKDHLRKAEKKRARKPKPKDKSAGVGYGTTGVPGAYGSGMFNDIADEDLIAADEAALMAEVHGRREPIIDHKEDDDEELHQDQSMAQAMILLCACLDPTSDGSAELVIFRLSTLLDRIITLLRNGSVADITERSEVYLAISHFLRAIMARPKLLPLLTEERFEKIDTPGLKVLGTPKKDQKKPHTGPTSKTIPLIASYANTFLQAKTFLKISVAGKDRPDFRTLQSIELFGELVDCFEGLEELASKIKCKAVTGFADIWNKFSENNRVTFSDEVLTLHKYGPSSHLVKDSKKGRLSTISKEIATLRTSLPPGIFLKVAESRSDMMKVLILGSEGSPYAGGLFTFDMFLDKDYPATPPKINFVMRGNDEDGESFNPNLHTGSGTVCISLLNTWAGTAAEQWQPYKSTILSVLVSMQAMILGVPLPWLNEPGFENARKTDPRVVAHRNRVETRVLRFAMIAWLENDFANEDAKEHIWKEISQTYWKHKGQKVWEYVKEFLVDNPGLLYFGRNEYWNEHFIGHSKRLLPNDDVNLVEKLANLLGIQYNADEFPVKPDPLPNVKGKSKRKIIVGPPKPNKKQKGALGKAGLQGLKWIYTEERNQKMTREACQEFGLSYAPTIQKTIVKLEKWVNENIDDLGTEPSDPLFKWGDMESDASTISEDEVGGYDEGEITESEFGMDDWEDAEAVVAAADYYQNSVAAAGVPPGPALSAFLQQMAGGSYNGPPPPSIQAGFGQMNALPQHTLTPSLTAALSMYGTPGVGNPFAGPSSTAASKGSGKSSKKSAKVKSK